MHLFEILDGKVWAFESIMHNSEVETVSVE